MRARSMIIAAAPPLAVLGLWFGAVVVPTGNSAGELQDRLDASDEELVALAAVLDDSRTASAELVAMNAELEQLRVAVPPTADVAGFVRLVHSLATGTGAVVSSVTPQTEQVSSVSSGAEVTRVLMSLEGDYSSVMSFIDALLTADRLVEVDSVDLASDSSADALFVELVVSVYAEPGTADAIGDLLDDADRQVSDAAAGLTLEAEG